MSEVQERLQCTVQIFTQAMNKTIVSFLKELVAEGLWMVEVIVARKDLLPDKNILTALNDRVHEELLKYIMTIGMEESGRVFWAEGILCNTNIQIFDRGDKVLIQVIGDLYVRESIPTTLPRRNRTMR